MAKKTTYLNFLLGVSFLFFIGGIVTYYEGKKEVQGDKYLYLGNLSEDDFQYEELEDGLTKKFVESKKDYFSLQMDATTDLETLLERQKEKGFGHLLVEAPQNPQQVEVLKKYKKSMNISILKGESKQKGTENGLFLDYQSLAEGFLKDILHFPIKKLYLLPGLEETYEQKNLLKALSSLCEKEKIPYELLQTTADAKNPEKLHNDILESVPRLKVEEALIVLERNDLEKAAQLLKQQEKRCYLFGTAKSDGIVQEVMKGNITGLYLENSYLMGYLGAETLLDQKSHILTNDDYRFLTKDNIQQKENDWYLYPLAKE